MQVEKSITRYEKIESLLHSAVDYDQIIMLESEFLAESLKEGSENYTKNVKALSEKLVRRSEQNCTLEESPCWEEIHGLRYFLLLLFGSEREQVTSVS